MFLFRIIKINRVFSLKICQLSASFEVFQRIDFQNFFKLSCQHHLLQYTSYNLFFHSSKELILDESLHIFFAPLGSYCTNIETTPYEIKRFNQGVAIDSTEESVICITQVL